MSVVNLEILSGITAIPDNLFRNMNLYYLETLTLPATLETIGDEAFSQVGRSSTAPLDITFPASLKIIGNGAFVNSGVTSISFAPSSTLTTIGNTAFYGAVELTGAITFPASLKTIDFSAFNGCSNINSISFETGSTLTTIGNNAFTDC